MSSTMTVSGFDIGGKSLGIQDSHPSQEGLETVLSVKKPVGRHSWAWQPRPAPLTLQSGPIIRKYHKILA